MAKNGFGQVLKSVFKFFSAPSISQMVARDSLIEELRASYKAEQYQDTLETIDRYLELAPHHAEAVAWYRTDCLLHLGREREAQALFNAEEASTSTRFVAAQYFNLNERYREALPLWKKLLRDHDDREFCETSVMICYLGTGAWDQARPFYNAEKSTTENIRLAANMLYSAGHYAEALAQYERALARNDNTAQEQRLNLVNGRIWCLEGLQRYDEVVKVLKAGDTPGAAILPCVDRLTYNRGQFAAALAAWDLIPPDADAETKLQALEGRVHCLVHLGRHAEAAALWRQPGADARVICAASRIYSAEGDAEHGIPIFEYLRQVAKEYFVPATQNLVELYALLNDRDQVRTLAEDPTTPLQAVYSAAIKFQTWGDSYSLQIFERLAEMPPAQNGPDLLAQMMANNKIGREEQAETYLQNPALHQYGFRAMGDFHDCNGNYSKAAYFYESGLEHVKPDLHYMSGYLRNRICVEDWPKALELRDRLEQCIAVDDQLQEPGRQRWRLYLDLVDGKFQDAWDKAAAMRPPLRQPIALKLRYQDVQVLTSALLGKLSDFDRLAEEYSQNPDRWERPAMLGTILASLAKRYHQTLDPSCLERLAAMPV